MKDNSPKAILHDLERFRQMGSLLYVAAHPDDENTELLAYLSRGRKYRTAYLSLTRGDGGQNLLGSDLGDRLGVARTQELLAARQIDGAHQFFSRAVDFGFSKNYQETLNVWDRQEVLSDIVRVIRKFRPDVIVTRFSPSPGGTHGHHTTSALLALEAFKLASDSRAFPELNLPPWQAKRILWNVGRFQKDKVTGEPVLKIETSGKDSVTDTYFFDVANASRAMHKTQGFDQYKLPGVSGERRFESFQLLGGPAPVSDIMDGVNTKWDRIRGGREVEDTISGIIDKFDPKKPSNSVASLLALRSRLALLTGEEPIVKEKIELLERIIKECLELEVETTLAHADVVPGEVMELHSVAKVQAAIPVRWVADRYPTLNKVIERNVYLKPGQPGCFDGSETLPADTPPTQPYWLRMEGTPGMFHVDSPELIASAENAPCFPIEHVFEVDGQELVVADEPVQVSTDSAGNQIRRRLDVIPPVALRFLCDVSVMTPGASRSVELEVKAARAGSRGTVELEAPPDWKVQPRSQAFDLSQMGQVAKFTFTLTAPAKSETSRIAASAEINGKHYQNQRIEVSYPHLPRQLLQPPAVVRAVSVPLEKRGSVIGYLPGAGDSISENLQQMGYAVKILDDAGLTLKDLDGVDAVVLGVRAFNVRNDIDKAVPVLFSYVEKGGTVVVQYNRPDKLKSEKIAPYAVNISAERVTDEKAPVTFLAPESPVLNTPNKITEEDFEGWVQERGLYFAGSWDADFVPILSCNDLGEPPAKGALLVARYGKGYYVYTGLSFFRQLPAAVPGAYRLFANLVSLGK